MLEKLKLLLKKSKLTQDWNKLNTEQCHWILLLPQVIYTTNVE